MSLIDKKGLKLKPIFYFNNERIKSSLQRFLYFVLHINFNNQKKEKEATSYFIFEENYKIDISLLNILKEQDNPHIIVIGYHTNLHFDNYINVLDLSNLKTNLNRALNNPIKNSSSLLYVKKIGAKINLFFKGHGEESLFNSLNWTRYYLSNGFNLLNENKLNFKETENVYLKPGLKYWVNFKNRFNKYKIYLKILGYKSEVEQVKTLISDFQKFIDCLNLISKENNIETNELNIKKNIDYLKQIDYIFINIHENITSQYESIQYISR